MRKAVFAIVALAIASTAAGQAQAPFVRPTDPEVRGLINQLDQARDRFEGALDGQLKNSILRSPTGEVNVSNYLNDLQRETSQLKDRYSDNYAASQEALVLLKRCSGLHAWVAGQPAAFKGRSEWEAMAKLLGSLASWYGTAFPTPEGATARRMSDKEVAQAAEVLAKSTDEFRKVTVKSMKTAKTDPTAIAAMERELKTLGAAAKTLKSQVGGHRPSTNEARLVLDQAVRVQGIVTKPPTAPDPAAAHWSSIQKNLQSIRDAFAMPGA